MHGLSGALLEFCVEESAACTTQIVMHHMCICTAHAPGTSVENSLLRLGKQAAQGLRVERRRFYDLQISDAVLATLAECFCYDHLMRNRIEDTMLSSMPGTAIAFHNACQWHCNTTMKLQVKALHAVTFTQHFTQPSKYIMHMMHPAAKMSCSAASTLSPVALLIDACHMTVSSSTTAITPVVL